MLQLSMEELYATRMARYVCAMHNGMPDRVPLRPFAAEITARHAGFTCQEVTHDYRKAFEAIIRCCHDYDWDATVPNMVYVWTGLTQAAGLTYYGVPGIDVEADVCFQYREPAEQTAFMKREEYDELIADPVRFLYETWLPRVSTEFSARGQAATFRNNLAFVKSSMAMMEYFTAFGPQVERMRRECGTVSAICGMLKAPLDILADKLRGYLGLAYDLMEMPEKVEQACRALMPHLGYLALTGADPSQQVPIPIWMHRGCTPFISKEHFERIYWPTLKPIVEALWAQGNQTLFYAEGKWDAHLESFAELPDAQHRLSPRPGQSANARTRCWAKKFCLSGGLPNVTDGVCPAGAGAGAMPQTDREHRRRRRLHHGCQRDHAERRHARKPARDDRGDARVRGLSFTIRAHACGGGARHDGGTSGVGQRGTAAARRLPDVGGKGARIAADERRRGAGEESLGRRRGAGVPVYLAFAIEFLGRVDAA